MYNNRNDNLTHVPLNLPDDNQSFSFLIPSNTSNYTVNFGTNVPLNKDYYRWVSDVTFRVDGGGIYNLEKLITVAWKDGSGDHFVEMGPGFYDISDINSALVGLLNIPLSGLNSHMAILDPGVIIGHIPDELKVILNWPNTVNTGFVPSSVVDIMLNKDLILVYASCVKQSQINNKTNLCSIAITDTNSVTIGNFHSKTPLLPHIDSIDSVVIRLRDINDNEYKINSPLFLNIKMLFSKK